MFHKILEVKPLDNYVLWVKFEDNIERYYNISLLFDKWEQFNDLKNNKLFEMVKVDKGGYGISWNDELDLSSEEIYNNGQENKQ